MTFGKRRMYYVWIICPNEIMYGRKVIYGKEENIWKVDNLWNLGNVYLETWVIYGWKYWKTG